MCFSANASFGAGIILAGIGIVSLKKTEHPSQVLFACIPLLFAVQQLTEGFLWLSLPNPIYASLSHILTYIFMFFANFFWPLWVPIAVLMLEREDKRKKIQKMLVGTGILVASYLGYSLLSYNVLATISGHHIYYTIDFPYPVVRYGGIFYIIATVAPPFFSHIKRMWMLSVTVIVSYIITAIFYDHYLVSVWCFFASIISISILIIMLEIRKLEKT